ncbi:hypothetical protein WR25_20593 [Diploscapter pachys]|uniref:C2H2-type domain-containing protein n=1 Tax=Diploscapter pachys TaxID=2018661 RepID=A0A2A2K5A6_9BILA|nr:hypothetical protein WR25_20593 [Diploscapter pachys]
MEASSSQNGDTTVGESAGPSDPFPFAPILTTEDDVDTEDMQQRLNRVLQTALRSLDTRIKSEVDEENVVEMLAGETKGPFPVKRAQEASSEGENQITLTDQTGRIHTFDVDSVDPIIKRIRPCGSALNANCVILSKEIASTNLIHLLITKDVSYGEDLLATFISMDAPDGSLACSPAATPNSTSPVAKQPLDIIAETLGIKPAAAISEKRFLCTRCNVAKFSSFENLQTHQRLYCRREENGAPRPNSSVFLFGPPSTSSDATPLIQQPLPSNLMHPPLPQQPNVIMLPLAYHDQPQEDLIKALGPPQTIIPVAIARPSAPHPILPVHPLSAPTTNSLILNKSTCNTINIPRDLRFNVGEFNVTVPMLNLDIGVMNGLKRAAPKLPGNGVQIGAPPAKINPAVKQIPLLNQLPVPVPVSLIGSLSDKASPLDLSKRKDEKEGGLEEKDKDKLETLPLFIKKDTESPQPSTSGTHKNSPSDVEKPFVCSCGIAFSVDATLKAHQQFYCKNVERPDDGKEPVRKVPSRCSQCDFEPSSLSQLSNHIRNAHHDVQAYLCKLCGYKGYSLRGIRHHMRSSHPHLEEVKFDSILNTEVVQVKSERKSSGHEEEDPK